MAEERVFVGMIWSELCIPPHFVPRSGLSKTQFQGAWDKSTGCFGQEPEFETMIFMQS